MTPRALMVMMEPTPYVDGLVVQLRSTWAGALECVFLGKDLSQRWSEVGTEQRTLAPGMLPGARELARMLRSGDYDLVHTAGWGHPLLALAILLGSALGVPVTVESDTPLRPNRGWLRRAVRRLAYPTFFRVPRLFLPAGSRQADYLRRYGVGPGRIRIAQMTVDTEAIRAHRARMSKDSRRMVREHMGLSSGQVTFLFVGRLEPHKGLRELLQAYERLRGQVGPAVALVVVGDGSMAGEVRSEARRIPGLIATGRLAGEGLRDAYCAADVFVLPSTDEPWGLVVNEAMAAGLPAILTDAVGCVDDLLVSGTTGIIVGVGRVPELEEAMHTLVDERDLREAMGRAAEIHIRPWTLRNEAVRIVSAWSEALEP